jgi:hypothetical protein
METTRLSWNMSRQLVSGYCLFLSGYCRIPFPSERIDTRRDFADYTPMQSPAEFAELAAAGLIRDEEDKLVIRGLCNNYRDLSEIGVFVTNMSNTVEDLAYLDGCIFRLMAWGEIHSKGFPYFHTLALCRRPTAWMIQNLAGPEKIRVKAY